MKYNSRKHNTLCHIRVKCDKRRANRLTFMPVPEYGRYLYFNFIDEVKSTLHNTTFDRHQECTCTLMIFFPQQLCKIINDFE